MEGTGVGPWLNLVYEKGHCGASFRLGERYLDSELQRCRFFDIKIGENISEACLITVLRREHRKQNDGDKDLYWEEIMVLHPDGMEHELVRNGFCLRANYDAHNNRAKLEKDYAFKRELKKLLAEKEEIERKIKWLSGFGD